jgi:hypothetical protein
MIHYNVWFALKDDANEVEELRNICSFLAALKHRSLIHDFKLLKGRASQTTLPPFQVMILFVDDAQFGRPFADVAAIGAHAGEHGSMIANVKTFMADTFEELVID